MKKNKIIAYIGGGLCLLALAAFVLQPIFGSLRKKKTLQIPEKARVEAEFSADSAYQYCAAQCAFGARTMNSEAHDRCAEWIKQTFAAMGCEIESQKADLRAFDGTILKGENIIARWNADVEPRILICAHWDSRPWADNDPDEANHRTPVLGANDGASGVAVMLELARSLSALQDSLLVEKAARLGIDFVCFDAEDWGVEGNDDSWALGAQHWAASEAAHGATFAYGILLDMVGGEGARFFQEFYSKRYADNIVNAVWTAARTAGYGSFFPMSDGGGITDDHVPVNQVAGIPCIDIIPYFADCEQSSFGPTWHTISDTMEHIAPTTLKAVGQTLLQVLLQ